MAGKLFGKINSTYTGRHAPEGAAWLLGQGDFDGDGLTDVVIGFNDMAEGNDEPLQIMLNNGDGTFTSGFEDVLEEFTANTPLLEIRDFNGDGRADIFMINPRYHAGSTVEGDFFAGPPKVLLSTTKGGYRVDHSIAAKYDEILDRYGADPTSPSIYTKTIVSGDIDGDGDLDMFLEAQGGWPQNEPHFLINDGKGNFDISWGERISNETFWSSLSDFVRYEATALADMDNDGDLDLVLGALHDGNHKVGRGEYRTGTPSVIVYNADGQFARTNIQELPLPEGFNKGVISTPAVDVLDLDHDGDNDIVFHQTRAAKFPGDGSAYTGRNVQVLINHEGIFIDESDTRFPNNRLTRSKTATDGITDDNINYALQDSSSVVDLNGDGHLDLLITAWREMSSNNPVFYINDGDGYFHAVPFDLFPQSTHDLSERGEFFAKPFDVNGDDLPDLVASYGWDKELQVHAWEALRRWSTGPEGVETAESGAPGFNEQWYLRNNRDAAVAVQKGEYATGLDHFLAEGKSAGLKTFAEDTHVRGHPGADRIELRRGDEVARGLGGADRILGFAGDDRLYAGAGDDQVIGGTGRDLIEGGSGHDILKAGSGNDRVGGGRGNDSLYGGKGDDLVAGSAGADHLMGNQGADVLKGGSGPDRLFGHGENDVLRGGKGADDLVGGAGRDLMYGGADTQRDTFIFADAEHSGTGPANRDRIFQFNPADDLLDLSTMDADSSKLGNQAFSHADGPAGHSIWMIEKSKSILVRADQDGDGHHDFEIQVMGVSSLMDENFVL